jgi:hypothetical protein
MIRICKHVKEFEELVRIFENEEVQIEDCVDKCEICCGTRQIFVIKDNETIVADTLDEFRNLL